MAFCSSCGSRVFPYDLTDSMTLSRRSALRQSLSHHPMMPSRHRLRWRSLNHGSTRRNRRSALWRNLSYHTTELGGRRPHGRRRPMPLRHHRPHSFGKRPRRRPGVPGTRQPSILALAGETLSASCCCPPSLTSLLSFLHYWGTKLDLGGVGWFLKGEPVGSKLGLQVPVGEFDQKAWEILNFRVGHHQTPWQWALAGCDPNLPMDTGPHERQVLARHPIHHV
jgi:hypothetical protein